MRFLPFKLMLAPIVLCLVLLPCPAQSDAPEDEGEVLETITVTARKREMDIQEAPVAISTVSGEDFTRANIVKLDNLTGYVPGLLVAKNDGAGRVVAIRGVGWETAQNLSTQPSVLVYLDGVYLANPLALGLDLGEIERIEVLRGPQGTEFGQGTTGGAINIITEKPSFGEATGSVSAGFGSYSQHREQATLNAGLSETVAVRAYVQNYDRDGFAQIEGGSLDGYELDDADSVTAHFGLTWLVGNATTVRLSAFLTDSDQGGAAQRHIDDPNPDPRRLTQDYPSTFALENNSYSAEINYLAGPSTSIKLLAGYQELAKAQTVDGDRLTEALTSVDLTGFGTNNFDVLPFWDNSSEATTLELNITHATANVDWIGGLYYLDHTNENYFLEAVGPAPFSQFADVLADPGPDTLPPFQPPLEFVEDRELTREDKAAYAQVVYHLNDRIALTAGARYQEDTSIDETVQFWFNESRLELEDDALTWKAGIDLDLTESNLVYGLISTGWKNGGNNPGALNGALDVPITFEPEEVTAFEIGSKNMLADGRARFNATVFYYDYENYQFIQEDPVPFSGGTGNIPELTIYGLETEFSYRVNPNLRLDGHLESLDGEIDSEFYTLDTVDFLNSGFGRFTATGVEDRASLRVNLAGNTPPKLVELGGRLTLTHTTAIGDGELTSRAGVVYRGEYQYRVFNNPTVDTVPSYTIANLFFGYRWSDIPLEISLSATNLFDEDGVSSRYSNPFGLHTTSEEYIPPRELIASLRYRF